MVAGKRAIMQKQQQYNVGVYVRLSKDDERAGESVSIENQKLMLTKYVKEQGWNEAEIYVDDGFSGTNFDRPAVTRLIEDAKDKKINLILVKDLSRFGRNYIQVGQFTDYLFPMIGCRFIALNDGVDTIHNDNDIMPFRNLFNEFQSRDTSKKIKAVKRTCAQNGMYVGAYAPYGYIKSEDKHTFLVDETAAVTVRKIFDLRCKGISFRKIARALNIEGILPPRDYFYQKKGEPNPCTCNHLWCDSTVQSIIRNEAYIGNMVQMKAGNLSYKNKKSVSKPQEEWIRVENTHEPIIERDTWNLCADIDREINKARCTGSGEVSLFGGLLWCMDCKNRMRHQQENHIRKSGRRVIYISYMCSNYSRSGKFACSAHIIGINPLCELVLTDIQKHASRALTDENEIRQELISQRNSESIKQRKADKAQIKTLQNRLSELDRLMQSLYEDKVLGSVPETVFKTLMMKYETERTEKSETLQVLSNKLAENEQDEQNVDSFINAIKKYVSVEQLDRQMLLEIIDHIEIGERREKDNQMYRDITIHYKFVGKIQ